MFTSIKRIYHFNDIPIRFGWVLLIAIILSIFLILQQFSNHVMTQYDYPFSWIDVSVKIFSNYFTWLVLLPFVHRLSRRLSKYKSLKVRNVLILLILIAITALTHRVLSLRINDLYYYFASGYLKSFFGFNNLIILNAGIFSSLIELAVILAILIGLDYQKDYISQQKELARAQLNALRIQLQPHFLFNTLHSISSMIDIDVKKAQKMITKLGVLLRHLLEVDQKQIVSLKEELDFINQYLALEEIRFQDHMHVKYLYDDSILQAKVPSLIMQPLIENAIKHGTASNGEMSEISVRTERSPKDGDWLILEVTNSHSTNVPSNKKIGIGLSNVRNRLIQLYDNAKFELIPLAESSGMKARIVIPYEEY